MAEAYIIDAVRTPVGKRNGALSQVHPADLGAHVLKALVQRNAIDPLAVEDVVFGCVNAVGPQAGDIARTCWLAAGLPEEVPGTTIDRQCGSSQQAVHFAAQAVMSGTTDLIIAGGVQNMSMVPIGSAGRVAQSLGWPSPFGGSEGIRARYGQVKLSQYRSAEMIAEKWGFSRQDMEAYALSSHQRAVRAIDEGRFDRNHPLRGAQNRRGSAPQHIARRKWQRSNRWKKAAGSPQPSQGRISDGASAMLIASEQAVKQYHLEPRARIHHISVRGANPVWMLTAPSPPPRTRSPARACRLPEHRPHRINEAFASVVIAWQKETGADVEKVNVNGGAIALGHPLGATGTRLMATLLWELIRTKGRYGLQTMCEGGGQANVTSPGEAFPIVKMSRKGAKTQRKEDAER